MTEKQATTAKTAKRGSRSRTSAGAEKPKRKPRATNTVPTNDVPSLQDRIARLTSERDRLQQSLTTILTSREWRLLQLLRRLRERIAPLGTERARWLWQLADMLLRRPAHLRGIPGPLVHADAQVAPRSELDAILAAHPDRQGIVIHPAMVDWDWMKQRPHQLVLQFARHGYLTFFCPPQSRTDFVGTFARVADKLYLCGCVDWLRDLPQPILLVSKPQDQRITRHFRDASIIYDCLDDVSVHVPGGEITPKVRRQHEALLQSATLVLATAQRLYEDVLRTRSDALHCPNAADFDHFQAGSALPTPVDLAAISSPDRPVIGYFGALAEWFDFDLLAGVAQRCADCDFVLIGPDYDGAFARQRATLPENVHWLGEKRYDDLPAYLLRFDVATIPFRVNEITKATSPIKLFEYFAAGKPVVTTPLPECQRQEHVLIGGSVDEFATCLRAALARKDDAKYRAAVVNTAQAHSWAARFEAIDARLQVAPVRSLDEVRHEAAATKGAVLFPRSIDWNVELFQRPHHLARYFARRGYTAVYVGGPRDGHFTGCRAIEPRLYVYRGPAEAPFTLPTPLVWSFCYNIPRRGQLPPSARVVYDLIDEPSIHPFSRRLLMRNHRRALREADVVAYVSRALEPLLRGREDRLYLPNGVEYERFAAEAQMFPDDDELGVLRSHEKPILGFYGALATWLDYDLLAEVARLRRDWDFLFIGPDYDGSFVQHPLQNEPNVLRIGPRPYTSLPGYLTLFDVATIPFKLNAVGRGASPLKMYEFFAAGKPVITTALPECAAFAEVQSVAGANEFASALDTARARGKDPVFVERLRTIARENSWDARISAVEARLQSGSGRNDTTAPSATD